MIFSSRRKTTYRQASKLLVKSDDRRLLVEFSHMEGKRFYINRSVENREKINLQFGSYYKLNTSLKHYPLKNNSVAIYLYLEELLDEVSDRPIAIILDIYKSIRPIKVDCEKTLQSLNGFLSAWPKEFEKNITNLNSYDAYRNCLINIAETSFCLEHGDYTKNNIKNKNGELFLFDFEFVKCFQPIGFDMLDYLLSIGSKDLTKVPNLELNLLKYDLINEINSMLDSI